MSVVSGVTSVGHRMKDAGVYGVNHPAYRDVVAAVSAEVAKKAQGDLERRAGAAPVVMTQVLSAELADVISTDFPEFRLVNYGMDKVGHAEFQAYAYMMNELMLNLSSRMATSVVHLGGRLLSSLLVPGLDVHCEMDPSCVVAVHERVRDTRATARVMGDYPVLMREGDFSHARNRYEEYVNRRQYMMCTSASCVKKADVYCVDGSKYAISPSQFVAGALQAGADVGYFFFPYHPVMLMQDEGEIPGTGIFYVKDFDRQVLRLRYTQGLCGAEEYSLASWAAWLVEHVVTMGVGDASRQYHIQLLKRRGPFIMAQVVKASVVASEVRLRHALELELDEPQYVVNGWQLKDLVRDPEDIASWVEVSFTAPKKVVDAVYAFGMQLTPENFSRYAIRRQFTMYDRVTVEGTSVTEGYRPSLSQLDMLTTMTHAELFVQRYEAGQLSKEMMSRLKAVASFAGASSMARFKAVAAWSMMRVWGSTVGRLAEGIADMCSWLENVLGRSAKRILPVFRVVPERLEFATAMQGWKAAVRSQYREAVSSVTGFHHENVRTVRGAAIASKLAVLEGVAPVVPVGSVNLLSKVHFGRVQVGLEVQSKTEVEGLDMTSERQELMNLMKAQNALDEGGSSRHMLQIQQYIRLPDPDKAAVREDQDVDPDFVGTMNEFYAKFNPGLVGKDINQDLASISHSDQDRLLQADKLRIPRLFLAQPKDKEFFRSKIKALGAPKRQETGPELLSAIAARNLAAPKVSLPQDDSSIIPAIWLRFLKVMCVENAESQLQRFQEDPVAMEERAYRDWMSQAKPEVVSRVARELQESDVPMLEQDVGRYLVMLKADVKPPLSDKPVRSRIEPQVIVYHSKGLSSMYSSVFRVLVRRFLSILKPNVHVNLLKDMDDIVGFLQAVHPFGGDLKYVENDFSKYDKSQDEFIFKLEQYVFGQLGMNKALLARWVTGHENCRLFSFTTGLSLHLRYQRKSGDATTAFGNVLLNIMSVAYAYGISDFAWALFMGDDSLIAVDGVMTVDEKAVAVLAEVFNLTAKTFVSQQPYFASWFFMFDSEHARVVGCPDPVKRIEKWSQAVSGVDPQWRDRYDGAHQTCQVYKYKANVKWLPMMVAQRYGMVTGDVVGLPAAVYTAVRSFENFRYMYAEKAEVFAV